MGKKKRLLLAILCETTASVDTVSRYDMFELPNERVNSCEFDLFLYVFSCHRLPILDLNFYFAVTEFLCAIFPETDPALFEVNSIFAAAIGMTIR